MNTITSQFRTSRYSDRREATLPGETLHMSDGSVWFHPYNGDAPVCIIRSDAERNLRHAR